MISSKRSPNLIESDRGKEFYNNIFQDFLNKNNIKLYSRSSSYGAVFAERFNRTIRDLLKRPVFEKCDGNWIDVLPTITKQYNNRIHTSTKLTPIQASLQKNEGYVYKNLLDKCNKNKTKVSIKRICSRYRFEKKHSRKEIQRIGLIKYIKLQNLSLILFRVIVLIIYQNVITMHC